MFSQMISRLVLGKNQIGYLISGGTLLIIIKKISGKGTLVLGLGSYIYLGWSDSVLPIK